MNNAVFVSGVQQSGPVIRTRTPILCQGFSHVGSYGVLDRVPCAIRQALVDSFLDRAACIRQSQLPNSSLPAQPFLCNGKVCFHSL